jgi:hypothetical protein
MSTNKRRGRAKGSMAVDKIAARLINLHISEGPDDELLNTAEVARWLRQSVIWVKTARTRGTGPRFVLVGGSVAYRRDAVREWIRSREVQTTVNKRSQYGKDETEAR